MRTKSIGLVLLASTLPVLLACGWAFFEARSTMREQTAQLLGARADGIRTALDGFHQDYLGSAQQLGLEPLIGRYLAAGPDERAALEPQLVELAALRLRLEPALLLVAVFDPTGEVVFGSLAGTKGVKAGHRGYFRQAMSTEGPIASDLFLALPVAGEAPLIAYCVAVRDQRGQRIGVAGLFIKAHAFWQVVTDAQGDAGKGSYAQVVDRYGIRIAQGLSRELLFRPTGPLEQAEITAMVDEGRFGAQTRELVRAPAPVPELYGRSRGSMADADGLIERVYARSNQAFNLMVARRLHRVPWTVFVAVPEATVYGAIDAVVARAALIALLVASLAFVFGLWLTGRLLAPIRELLAATDALATGASRTRVAVHTRDELGKLGTRFNEMAEAVEHHRDRLEVSVAERTANLEQANAELVAQRAELIAQREELQNQQHELDRRNQEVERADRMKSEFLANMSHELRTPLNSVIGFSELLLEETKSTLGERHRRFVQDVLSSGQHLLQLINDVLDLSKIEAGRLVLDRVATSPADAVEEACSLVAASAYKRNITIAPRVVSTEPVDADPAKLRQVLLNLLSNAIKFSPEGSRIEVVAELLGGALRFSVRDQGPGIDERLATNLFEPFVQGESALVKRHQGTGLGLAISKRLVTAHGGTIDYASTMAGTTFWFTMPLASRSVVPEPLLERPPTGRVLVVDDDLSVRSLLKYVLGHAGFEVLVADSGREGLATAAAAQPDLVCVDLQLPDISGYEVIEALAADGRTTRIPILVLSAADLDEADRARLRPHVKAVATKGTIVSEELIDAVQRAMGQKPARHSDRPDARSAPRVLVVDDHDLNRGLLRSILERRGFEVHEAEDGVVALELARSLRPALILMDMAMPNKDGYTATRELKQDPRTATIPIVGLSALAMRGDEAKAREAGVDDYLTKPVDRTRLEETIDRLIRP